MASILKVDTIQDQAGNNIISENANVITIGASGDTITIPSGATLANSGIITGFESTGIDDNATSTAITINSSEQVEFTAGTASLPSISKNGDTNTGIFFPSADTIAFTEGGTEAMRINSSGNVGIGTNSPDRLLHIKSTGNTRAKIEAGTTSTFGQLYLGTENQWIIGYGSTHPVADALSFKNVNANGTIRFFNSGDNERMRIDSSGKLLVGTTSESQGTLTVHSDVDYTTTEFEDNNALTLKNNDLTNPACMVFRGSNSGGSTFRSGITGGYSNNGGQGIGFYGDIINKDRNDNPDVFIRSDGRVGIGETAMDALLVIKGDSDESTIPSIRLKDGSDSREAWITNNSGDLILTTGGNDNVPHTQLRMLNGNLMTFKTNNSERMRINSSGNVLVGNTDNSTLANLEVENSLGIQDLNFHTIELGKGHSGSVSTITLTFDADYYAAHTIIEVQMFGYNSKYLDHIVGSYAGGSGVVVRNNASGATVTFSSTGTGTPYINTFTHVITASVTHPIVKYKISRGGGNGNGFTTKPTITFA